MAQQIINVGATPNDGAGDPIRTAFTKCNNNFGQLYSRVQVTPPTSLIGQIGDEAGMYAYDSTYFYYCFADYDGSSVIWAQVTQVGNISTNQLSSGNSNVVISGAGGNVVMGINGVPNAAVFTATTANLVGNVVAGGYFIGDGSLLTGLPQTYANANVTAYAESGWAGNIIPAGNAVYNLGSATNQFRDLYLSNSSLYLGNVQLTTTGTQLQVNGNTVITTGTPITGNISVTGNITGNNVNATNNLTVSNTANISNISSTGLSSLTTVTATTVSATGNITGGNVNTAGVVAAGNLSIAGTVTSANINATSISITGNVTGGNVNTAGVITATGNIDGGNVNTAGVVTATGNITGGNVNTAGVVTATGNITAPWFVGNVIGNAITTGNISASGNISADGNVIANNVIGNTLSTVGNVLAGNLSLTGNITSEANLSSNLTVANTVTTSNLVALYANINSIAGLDVYSGDIRVTEELGQGGNITANIINTFNLSIAGNITSEANLSGNLAVASNISATNISLIGNVRAAYANINTPDGLDVYTGDIRVIDDLGTGGNISATGNITANNTMAFANVAVLGGDPLSATDTTIAFKIPVTINGNVYYIALTAAQ